VTTIYIPAATRLTVAEAKRLISDAAPRGEAVDIYAVVDDQGNIDFDGPIETRLNKNANITGQYIDRDFQGLCEELGIVIRDKHRPLRTDYPNMSNVDEYWTIAHDEFVRLAALHGLLVEIGEAPEPQTPPVVTGEIDFTMVATRKELIDAFGKFTDLNMTWFDNLTDTPKLKAARKFAGQGGRNGTEPLFCPFEVMQWLVSPKRRKGRPIEVNTAWRMLESYFPRVYAQYSIGDPRTD